MQLTRKESLSLSLFLILICIIVMDGALILPNQVLIAAHLDIDFDVIGLIVGIYIFVTGISVIFFGYLTDLIERKNLLIFAGFLWSFTAIMHITIETLWQLLLLRIIAAIATGVTTPVAFSYLSDVVSSDSRSKAFALWGLITTLGSIIAALIALSYNRIPYKDIDVEKHSISEIMATISAKYPHLLDTWRYPFLTLGIIALIFTILCIFLTTEPKRAGSEKFLKEVLSDDDLQYSYRIKGSDLKYIFTRKSNFFLIMNFFDVVATGILMAYLFLYLNVEMGISFSDPEGISKIIVLLLIAGPLGFIIGQFGLSHLADKKVQGGDITARVKVATICGILNLPFLLVGFSMTPNVRNHTFFFGTLAVGNIEFWILWIIFSLLLGIGLAFTFGIAPNWYSSLIDVNLPEHRGTMIAMASFVDTIGRGLGAIIGGLFIVWTDSISGTIFWATLIFGIASTALWIPLFYTCDKDFEEINEILKQRAEELKNKQEKQIKKNQ